MDKRYWKRTGSGALEARAFDYFGQLNTRVFVSKVGRKYVIETRTIGCSRVSGPRREYRRQIDAITECGVCFKLRHW